MKVGLYSVNDKAMFDALNQSKVTNDNVKNLFLRRGTIISKETTRKALALDFSKNFHGYKDFEYLSNIFGSIGRREKLSINILNADVERSEIDNAVDEVCANLQKDGDLTDVNYTPNGLEISIKYVKLDFKMSEFRQSSVREAKIQIEKNDSGEYTTRFPQNSKSREFNTKLLEHINNLNSGKKASLDEISLEVVKDSSKRSEFFKELIVQMSKLKCIDVSDVYVTHPAIDAVSQTDDDEDDDEGKDIDDAVTDIGYHISKASLKGRGVLDSPELIELLNNGFYITRIIWCSVYEDQYDSDKYEFEAQFVDTENCKLFSYLVRGFYKYKKLNQFTNRQVIDKDREKIFLLLIESTARKISDDIIKSQITEVEIQD